MCTKKKRCKTCLRNKPLSEFYDHKTNRDRLFHVCKACLCEAGHRRYHGRLEVRKRITEGKRRWRKQNPLRAKAQQASDGANARASQKGVAGRITADDVIRAWEISGYRCAVGGEDLSKKDGNLTIDHTTPMSCGGTNTPDNLRAACRSCNQKEYWRWWRLDKARAA